KSLQQVRSAFGSTGSIAGRSSKDLMHLSRGKVARNEEDEKWLAKLRNLGLKQEDELKLLALREFIWRLSKIRPRDPADGDNAAQSGFVSLKALGVTPQTVFFNEQPLTDPSLDVG